MKIGYLYMEREKREFKHIAEIMHSSVSSVTRHTKQRIVMPCSRLLSVKKNVLFHAQWELLSLNDRFERRIIHFLFLQIIKQETVICISFSSLLSSYSRNNTFGLYLMQNRHECDGILQGYTRPSYIPFAFLWHVIVTTKLSQKYEKKAHKLIKILTLQFLSKGTIFSRAWLN